MGLLDDFRGKEEINQLKKQLTEKYDEVANLQTKLDEQRIANELEVTRLSNSAEESATANSALSRKLEQAKLANDRLTNDFEALVRSTAEDKSQAAITIADMNKKLAANAPEVAAIKAERDRTAQEIQGLQASYDDKDRGYQEREAKLAKKSEELLHERQKFQQQAMDLQRREQHWKQVVEPQLARYEAHCSLDLREQKLNALEAQLVVRDRDLNDLEADLIRRQCTDATLRAREAEIVEWENLLSDKEKNLQSTAEILNARRRSIEEKEVEQLAEAQRLSAFQARVDRLDKDEEALLEREKRLEIKKSVQAENHKIKLSKIRADRSALKTLKNQLDAHELDIKQREKEVKREEAQVLSLKNKNFALRKEEKRLNALLEECEGEKQKESSTKDSLQKENVTLKARIGELIQAAGKRKGASQPQESSEIEIGVYDPAIHGGEIAPPPPAFRSNTPLTALHYHVGLSGIEDADERRELLRSIISCALKKLPKVGSSEYMHQWGEGKSPQRVRCMAYHLSWNIGFQGAKDTNELARQHWLDDLKWLTQHYKAKVPASKWPKVPVS